jgi:hypothetical protein
MPWFVTSRVRFLHVPKTGGTWATYAMAGAGVPALRPEPSPAHANLAESRTYDDLFTFAFVRHPLEFWRSYWAYRVRTGWDDNPLDREAGSENFEAFIEGVLAIAPGHASRLFEQFVGPPEAEITFIGRHEHLADDVCLALRIAGEPFDEALLRSHPKRLVSDYSAPGSLYPASLARRLADAEQIAIERFYPWDPVPAHLVADNGAHASRPQPAGQVADLTIRLRNARAELAQTRNLLELSELRGQAGQPEPATAPYSLLRALRDSARLPRRHASR